MLQRIQSVWLLLVAAFDATTFRFPFYSGDRIVNQATHSTAYTPLEASTTIWLTILTILTGAIGFVTIFLFSNRKLQLKLCYLGIFLSIVLLVMYFLELANYTNGSITLWCLFYFAILVFYILAARGVYNDQKLIKSMDRLR